MMNGLNFTLSDASFSIAFDFPTGSIFFSSSLRLKIDGTALYM